MPHHSSRGTTRVANVLLYTAVSAWLALTMLLCSCNTAPVAASSVGQLDALALRLGATPAWQKMWQRTEQQRVCRLSALMQELQAATSLPGLRAELTWYAANQRAKYVAADMQQLLRADARAAEAIDSPEATATPGLHFLGHSQLDLDYSSSSSSSSSSDGHAEHLGDLFVMAPDGDGPMLLPVLSEGPDTYNSLMHSPEDDAATSTDCYHMATGGAFGQSKSSAVNKQHSLQPYDEVNGDMAMKAAATAQLTTADLLFGEEVTVPATQQFVQQPAPAASRRSRRLLAADISSSSGGTSSAAEGFAGLLDGVQITGLAGHDGKLVSIQYLPVVTSSEDVRSEVGTGAGKAVLPQSAVGVSRNQQDYRIIGGVEAPKDRYKWVCSLRGSNDFHFCGCSLIAPSVVLTAAHCLDQLDTSLSLPWVELRCGHAATCSHRGIVVCCRLTMADFSLQHLNLRLASEGHSIGRYYLTGANETTNSYDRIKCTKSIVHPGWSFDTGLNDIALCFLRDQSRFQPVTLVAEGGTPKDGTPVTVMGWGAQAEDGTNAPKLMEVEVNVTPLDSCSATYQGAIRETQLCAGVPEGGKDACQGDSGGPLILSGKDADADVQVGIVSYGVGCGRPNIPGVYTDISKYRGYITEHLLTNGISYAPVTGDGKALTPSSTTASASPAVIATDSSSTSDSKCACSSNGYSGSTFIGQALAGCKQHGLDFGDRSFYCYAVGGAHCAAAAASSAYPGAAWITCDPQSQPKETTVPVSTPSATAASSTGASGGSGSTGNIVDLSGLLQSLQSWITFNAMSNNTGSAATTNRTQAVASDSNSSSHVAAIRAAVRRAATAAEAGRR